MPGSPEDAAWFEVPAASYIAALAAGSLARRSGRLRPNARSIGPVDRPLDARSRSPSTGPRAARPPRPAPAPSAPVGPAGPAPARPATGAATPLPPSPDPGPDAASGPDAARARAVAVLDPVASRDAPAAVRPRPPASLDTAGDRALGRRPRGHGRPPERADRGQRRGSVRPVRSPRGRRPRRRAATDATAGHGSVRHEPGARRRTLRGGRDRRGPGARRRGGAARRAARLRHAPRARRAAQADADPRALAAGKDQLHRQFRAATALARARTTPRRPPASGWTQINDLNIRARDALRLADAAPRSSGPRCRGSSAWASRRTPHGSARRTPRSRCREAQSQLAACEEAEVRRAGGRTAPDAAAASATRSTSALDRRSGDGAGRFERQVAAVQEALVRRRRRSSSGSCAATGRRGTGWSPRSRRATPRPSGRGRRGSRRLVGAITGAGDRGRLPRHARGRPVLVDVPAARVARDRRRAVGARLPVRRRGRVRGRAGPGPARPVARGRLRGPRPDADPELAARAGAGRSVPQRGRRRGRVARAQRRRPDAGRDGGRAGPARRQPRRRVERLGPRPAAAALAD